GRIGTVWSTLRYRMVIRAEDACVRRQSMRIRIGIGLASALVLVATAATVASVTTRASATTATAARGGPATASVATASGAAASAAAATRIENVPAFGHVFLIIGENTTYSHLTATNAPYLMGTIRPRSAWLTNYYAATHWSQANYVALVTGQFTRCEQKDGGI